MGTVAHISNGTRVRSLDDIETEVFAAVDRMCLKVGELLFEAREMDRAGFREWVDTRMPFGFDKANRLIAIHLAYRELPAETLAELPRPWQALYALRHWTGGRLEQAIQRGEIGPATTVATAKSIARDWSKTQGRDVERYSAADLCAGKLMGFEPELLDEHVFNALARWVARRADPR